MEKKGFLSMVLAAVYVVLIVLLLIQNGCRRSPETEAEEESVIEAAEEVGGDGEIKITLLWDFYGDVDLHVVQPNGVELSFRNMSDTSTGGKLDVDNREGGRGSAENIFWTHPQRGVYTVSVVFYHRSPRHPSSGVAKVVVKNNGRQDVYSVRLEREGQQKRVASFRYDPQAVVEEVIEL